MPVVEFQGFAAKIEVPDGTLIYDAARSAGISLELPCGGKGTCGKCAVKIIEGTVDFGDNSSLPDNLKENGYVLACKARIKGAPVKIEIPDSLQKVRAMDDSYDFFREEIPSVEPSPITRKISLIVPQAQRDDGLSDLDRLNRELKNIIFPGETISINALRTLASALRKNSGKVHVNISALENERKIISVNDDSVIRDNFGIAVDLGTTTIAVMIVNLDSNKILARKSAYNLQISCGLDVISRINFAQRKNGLAELRDKALMSINDLLKKIEAENHIDIRSITCAVISGNTVMTHLLLGLDPEHIRLDPYTPTIFSAPVYPANEIGLDIHPDAPVWLSPSVGSYVGGDITAGLLCTDLADGNDDLSFFIDIGTNGEIVLGNKDFLMSCACSAGPAFEGGGLKFGMRASSGAIDKITVDPVTGNSNYSVIGNEKPRGICGSGIIDLISELFVNGWLEPSGKFTHQKKSNNVVIDGRRAHYIIADENSSYDGAPITITEQEIENILRAKAAIYSASSLMLAHVGLKFSDIKNFYIAGGFGRFLNIENAVSIGLLPDIERSRFKYIGNSSLTGSYLVLMSDKMRKQQTDIARRITYIDLSSEPNYMDHYSAALFLPHTDAAQFPGVHKKIKK